MSTHRLRGSLPPHALPLRRSAPHRKVASVPPARRSAAATAPAASPTGPAGSNAVGATNGLVDLSRVVIAVDGPSGSGKSTVARRVASRLGLRYLDTGAMYRAVTWQALEQGVALDDPAALAALTGRTVLTVGTHPRRPAIAVDSVDVSEPIRSRRVTNAVSAVSAVPAVRAELVRRQRELIGAGGIVVEGRDIGTTVAPEAPVKIFLTASSSARVDRRHRQLSSIGEVDDADVTREEVDRRDALDSGRAASPLAQADDAFVIDSTGMTIGEVVDAVLDRAAAAGVPVRRPATRGTS